eukprot:1146287-Pelagomonas_calceolata.AAC.6
MDEQNDLTAGVLLVVKLAARGPRPCETRTTAATKATTGSDGGMRAKWRLQQRCLNTACQSAPMNEHKGQEEGLG